jgi:hypothetical protein
MIGITREEPFVGEQDRDTGRAELVLDDIEGLLEIAQEATHVAHDEDIVTIFGLGSDWELRTFIRTPGYGEPTLRAD